MSTPQLRAAAEIVDERFGRGRGKITEREIDVARQFVDKYDALKADPFGVPKKWQGISGEERRLLRDALDQLDENLHGRPPEERLPFCTSLATSAIREPNLRRCAEVAATIAQEEFGELTAHGLRTARHALRQLEAGNPPPELARLLGDEDAKSAFSRDNLEALRLFFNTGKGGILHAGKISISGEVFEEVHELPTAGIKDEQALLSLIQDYEQRFQTCGYDRIYVSGQGDALYVALSKSGSLEHVHPKMRVTICERGGKACDEAAHVVHVVDVNNSLSEATLGLWANLFARMGEVLRAQFGTSLDDRIKRVADGPVDPAAPAAPPAPAPPNLWVLGGVSAGVGALAVTAPAVLGVLAFVGGLVTISSLVQYLRNVARRDKAPIYHAMGVTLARPGPVRY
jgi:hypothetical protein